MKAVLQRVARAAVHIQGRTHSKIGRGQLILLGVEKIDRDQHADSLARKAWELRIFDDPAGKMNLSAQAVGGAFLVVSQFTLLADLRRGRRPSFEPAAPPEQAAPLYERFVRTLRACGAEVQTGVFGARMEIELINDGPVTLILETPNDARRDPVDR
ncbi:MAG TPA: D-aminoacyl-tRNA deacylase [Acidobacteriota bacterium]